MRGRGVCGAASIAPAEVYVFANTEVRKEPAILIDQADGSRLGWQAARVAVVNPATARRWMRTGARLEQHGLARPAGPEKHHLVATVDVEFIHAERKSADAAAQPFNAQHRRLPSAL